MSNINDNTLKQNTILYGKSHTYTIERVLGQGSFGITYLAMTQVKVSGSLGELETTIQVAIKEFFMRDINGREENTVTCGSRGGVYYDYKKKFSREAENLSKLNHPHIVKVLEYFEANNTVYYAMEYVDGGNLDTYIAQHKSLTEAESIEYAKQIGSALSYMHAHKMLHLDLKPGNIMLRKNKEAVLIDFGLSKQYDENGKPETSTTVGSGTPGYAPIEQSNYHEGKDFPATMDVYALGATMYKMLTGIRPPEASEILNDGFPAYELQKRQVSDSLIASIAKVMSAMKKDRPQSVAAFLSILENKDTETTPKEDIGITLEEATVIQTSANEEQTMPSSDDISSQPHPKNLKYIILVLIAVLSIGGIIAYITSSTGSNSDTDTETEWLSATDTVTNSEPDNASSVTVHAGTSAENINPNSHVKENAATGNVERPAQQNTETANLSAMSANMPPKKKNGFKETAKAAEQGNTEAQYELGRMYFLGRDVAKNATEAEKWYQKAAEQGIASAQYKLGYMYDYGQGISQNRVEAAKWYKKAAEQENVDAQYRLGNMFFYKVGIPEDIDEAIKWYKKAAEQGDIKAQKKLGEIYSNGARKKDPEAIKWYKMAAERGDAEALKRLGDIYEKENALEAVKWYKMAIEQGNASASFNLGLIYEYGKPGIPKNKAEAIKWYRKAAEQGSETAQKIYANLRMSNRVRVEIAGTSFYTIISYKNRHLYIDYHSISTKIKSYAITIRHSPPRRKI